MVPAVIRSVHVLLPLGSLLMFHYLPSVRVSPTALGALPTNPADDTTDNYPSAGTMWVVNMTTTAGVTMPGTVPVTWAPATNDTETDYKPSEPSTALYDFHHTHVTVVVTVVTGPLTTPNT